MDKIQTEPSAELSYANQRTFGVVAGRSHVEISPKYGGEFKSGDIIRLEIPSQAWLDPKEFYISFRTSIVAGINGIGTDPTRKNALEYMTSASTQLSGDANQTRGESSVRFVPGIQSIFNRVRLLAGSVVIEDIQDYNVLYRIFMENSTTDAWRQTDGFMYEGWYDPASKDQVIQNHNFHAYYPGTAPLFGGTGRSVNLGHTYAVRPLLGLFMANKALPLKYMGQLTIELYLEDNQEALWSSTTFVPTIANNGFVPPSVELAVNQTVPTYPDIYAINGVGGINSGQVLSEALLNVSYPNATYVVEQVRMHVPFIHPMDSFDQQMMGLIESGQLDIHFATWQTHNRQLNSIGGRTTLSFQERAISLKGGLCCFRNSPDIRAIDNDMSFPANGITAYQWKVGSEYLPAQEVDCTEGGSRALAQLKQSLGAYSDMNATSTIMQHNFLPMDLPSQLETQNYSELRRMCGEPSKFVMGLSLEKSPGQTSGFDSSASSVDVELILTTATHSSLVGVAPQVPGVEDVKYYGSIAGTTFQPSKKRCTASQRVLNANSSLAFELNTSSLEDGSNSIETWPNATPAAGVIKILDDTRRHGHMYTKNTAVTFTVDVNNHIVNDYVVVPNQTGVYTRVTFFAHLDAVLKLSAVGRMEIVR